MAARFTFFLKHNEKEINLYIKQEQPDRNQLCFDIYLRDGETFEFSLFRKNCKDWNIFPQNVPDWVKNIQPRLIQMIEQELQASWMAK